MPRLLCRLAATLPVALLLVVPASAEPVELTTGMTYEKQVQFTPRGPVALTVITAPKPGPLTSIGPALAGGTMTGPRLKLTQIQRSLGPTAISAGISGDFTGASGSPGGIVVANGVYQHGPTPGRSSIGLDGDGVLRVTRFSFAGTWKGTGQRRPLAGINQKPKGNQTVVFTPAWGVSTPDLPNATAVTLDQFPAMAPNIDLQGNAASVATGSVPIPAGGAVLVASGTEAAKLANEAAAGTPVTARLILPTSWTGVTGAIGGGPPLVRNRKAVFKTSENFVAADLAARDARTAIGQLEDGRVILVAVDGGRPGYSVGVTAYELAQTMVRLGAVTAAALEPGKVVTAAFQGVVLNRPSNPGGEKPLREALLVQYVGVHAPAPPLPQLDRVNQAEQLSYTVFRPSNVTAVLVAPDGSTRPVDAGARQPGPYRFSWTAFDAEGTWHWKVSATDDQNRESVADRPFQVDYTLSALKASSGTRPLKVGFTLSRPASVTLQIETKAGAVVAQLPAAALEAGAQSLAWDGTTTTGAKAPRAQLVAHVIATSTVGTANLSALFTLGS